MVDNSRLPSRPSRTHAMVAPLGNARHFVPPADSPPTSDPATPAAPAGPAELPAHTDTKHRSLARSSAFLGLELQRRLLQLPARVKSIARGRPAQDDKQERTAQAPPLPAGWRAADDMIPPEHHATTPDALAVLVGRHATKVHVPPGGVLVNVTEPASPGLMPPARREQAGSIRRKPLPPGVRVALRNGMTAPGAPAAGETRDSATASGPGPDAAPPAVPPRPALPPYPLDGMPAEAVMPEPHRFRRSAIPKDTNTPPPPPPPPPPPLPPKEPLEPVQPAQPPPRPPKTPF